MRSYSIKQNPINSAVSEILRYKQTSCYFIIRIMEKNNKCAIFSTDNLLIWYGIETLCWEQQLWAGQNMPLSVEGNSLVLNSPLGGVVKKYVSS